MNNIARKLSSLLVRSDLKQTIGMERKSLRLGILQMASSMDKNKNLWNAKKKIKELMVHNCDVVVLPECFNSPYGTEYFAKYSEEVPNGETSQFLKQEAKENNIYLVGGSIPEREGENLYNTATVWSPQGELVCRHRKIHLFDIDIPNGIKFQESSVLKAGSEVTTFTVENWKFGIGICYDLRFEELAKVYRKRGCHVLLYPGAFNLITGPLHWELLLRGRAVDNQVYVAGISGAYSCDSNYKAWGHSSIIDPMGAILATTEQDEDVLYADLDMNALEKVRQQIPVYGQRCTDIYDTLEK